LARAPLEATSRSLHLLVPLPQLARQAERPSWVPSCNDPLGYLPTNDRSRSNHRAISDRRARQHDRPGADVAVVTDNHTTHLRITGQMLDGGIVGDDPGVMRDSDVRADCNRPCERGIDVNPRCEKDRSRRVQAVTTKLRKSQFAAKASEQTLATRQRDNRYNRARSHQRRTYYYDLRPDSLAAATTSRAGDAARPSLMAP
jgi:hypothetical protein